MSVADKIAALFAAMQPQDLDQLSPVERRRFADICRHWAALADRTGAVAFRAGGGEHAQASAAPAGSERS